jgi:hypothetical protein
MVPLNLGAAAPFRLNPHFLQVVAASSFSVPQFGQNTAQPPLEGRSPFEPEPTLERPSAIHKQFLAGELDTSLCGSLRFASPETPGL